MHHQRLGPYHVRDGAAKGEKRWCANPGVLLGLPATRGLRATVRPGLALIPKTQFRDRLQDEEMKVMSLPETAGTTQIAMLVGVTGRQIRKLCAAGVLPPAVRGQHPLADTVQAWTKHREAAAVGPGGGAGKEFQDARVRWMRSRAAIAEREEARSRGELLPAADVRETWIAAGHLIKTRILIVPQKLGGRFGAKVAEAAREFLHEALADIAATKVIAKVKSEDADGSNAA